MLIQILLFLTPFAVYAAVLALTQRDARDSEHWPTRMVIILSIAGLALAIVGLAYFAHFGGSAPGGTYEPARFEDGKLLPGKIR